MMTFFCDVIVPAQMSVLCLRGRNLNLIHCIYITLRDTLHTECVCGVTPRPELVPDTNLISSREEAGLILTVHQLPWCLVLVLDEV